MIKVRLPLVLLPLLLVILVSGCQSKNPNAPAQVGGTVKYKGQPLKGGKVTFHTLEGLGLSAVIRDDGTYTISDIPADDFKISVETESINPATNKPQDYSQGGHKSQAYNPPGAPANAGKGPDPANYVKIPEKYSKPDTSGLSVTLKPGKNWKDIDMD